jgi:hypothetical protein
LVKYIIIHANDAGRPDANCTNIYAELKTFLVFAAAHKQTWRQGQCCSGKLEGTERSGFWFGGSIRVHINRLKGSMDVVCPVNVSKGVSAPLFDPAVLREYTPHFFMSLYYDIAL